MISHFDSVVWITSRIAAIMAIVITIVFPAGYFAISYQYMKGSLDTHAEIAARTTERLVMANPTTWQFEEIRLQELLQRRINPQVPELRLIVDNHGNVIAQMTDPLSTPLVTRRCDIYDAGDIVGQVQVSRSLCPLLIQTALICVVSSLAGLCLFLILRILPLRALKAERLKSKALEAQNRQLHKAESLSRMAGAIAHHFNNQLMVVMGNLEIAMQHRPRDNESYENMTEAMQAARKAAEVSGLMLTYLGQTTARREPIDISEICRLSLPLLYTTLPKFIFLETDFPSPGPIINGNANQIQQVLTNLVSNAGESIPDGRGSIHLKVTTVSTENIPRSYRRPLEWQPQGNVHACLEVRDSGCGIAETDIEKIFDPFFTSKFAGRGLGLAVVLGILRPHGGAITVESEPARGSCFRVFFPLPAEAVIRSTEKSTEASAVEGGKTLLRQFNTGSRDY